MWLSFRKMHIHITRKGEQHGPYSEANAREMLAAGQLLPTDLAWYDGADGWKPLSEVLGVAAQPPAPPSEPNDPDKISVTRKGEPIGPYSREEAKEYFASGQLLPTDWGWHDGMNDWKPINEVLGMAASTKANAATEVPKWKKAFYIFSGLCSLIFLLFVGYGILHMINMSRKHGGAPAVSGEFNNYSELQKKRVEDIRRLLPGVWQGGTDLNESWITFLGYNDGGPTWHQNYDFRRFHTQGGPLVLEKERHTPKAFIRWDLRHHDGGPEVDVTWSNGEREFVYIYKFFFSHTHPIGFDNPVLSHVGRVDDSFWGERIYHAEKKIRMYYAVPERWPALSDYQSPRPLTEAELEELGKALKAAGERPVGE
jgi:hypothetical protein